MFDELDQSRFSIELLPELREALDEIDRDKFDDLTLARFLCARNGRVADAANMLKAHLTWRDGHWPVLKVYSTDEFLFSRPM